MYGIDWTAPIPEPGRTRKNKTCKTKGKIVKQAKLKKWPQPRNKPDKVGGRKKGDAVNSPESRARAAKTIQESAWRRRTKDTGGTITSSSGSAGEADFSMTDSGRVYPRFSKWDRGWNE